MTDLLSYAGAQKLAQQIRALLAQARPRTRHDLAGELGRGVEIYGVRSNLLDRLPLPERSRTPTSEPPTLKSLQQPGGFNRDRSHPQIFSVSDFLFNSTPHFDSTRHGGGRQSLRRGAERPAPVPR